MNIGEIRDSLSDELMGLVEELLPIPRSITGEGVRDTLRRLQRLIPLEIREVATGTRVFDWAIPEEWNLREAYVRAPTGEKVIDLARSNLHVVGYSAPVDLRLGLADLKEHIYTLPDHPDWIPYKTSYFTRTWGFCLQHRVLADLPEGEYEVRIDSTLASGSLTYGELLVPGASDEEVLVSTHVCHPTMCNDNLSGIAVATFLAREIARAPRRLSYRFLFVPGTLGSLAWLAGNEPGLHKIGNGIVLSGVGDRGGFTYKKSRNGNASIDRAASHILSGVKEDYEIRPFEPLGYDERQYCSPGIDLPVGCLMRTPWNEYPEYHTSGDDLGFVEGKQLAGTLEVCQGIFRILDHDRTYLRADPRGEPQLGRRGLLPSTGGLRSRAELERAILWILNLSDGNHTLLDIAERAGIGFEEVLSATEILAESGLVVLAPDSGGLDPGAGPGMGPRA